jgi:hypothetical protein
MVDIPAVRVAGSSFTASIAARRTFKGTNRCRVEPFEPDDLRSNRIQTHTSRGLMWGPVGTDVTFAGSTSPIRILVLSPGPGLWRRQRRQTKTSTSKLTSTRVPITTLMMTVRGRPDAGAGELMRGKCCLMMYCGNADLVDDVCGPGGPGVTEGVEDGPMAAARTPIVTNTPSSDHVETERVPSQMEE